MNYSSYRSLEANGLWSKEEGKLHRKELYRRMNIVWKMFDEKLKNLRAGEKEPAEPPAHTITKMLGLDEKAYKAYHQIDDSESIIALLLKGKKIHESYQKEAFVVCEDILAHEEEERESDRRYNNTGKCMNVEIAKKFLAKMKAK